MKKNKLIHVGTFGQPYGLRGEIKLKILTSSLESFKLLSKDFINNKNTSLKFNKIRKVGSNNVVSLPNYSDRNSVKKLVGTYIFCERKNFPQTTDSQYYVIDLIDCTVVNLNKKKLGKIVNIQNFGAGDLMEIQNNEKQKFYIPMNKDNLVNVNLTKKMIIVNPLQGLLD